MTATIEFYNSKIHFYAEKLKKKKTKSRGSYVKMKWYFIQFKKKMFIFNKKNQFISILNNTRNVLVTGEKKTESRRIVNLIKFAIYLGFKYLIIRFQSV